ncbi:hypothetical protein LCGC14_2128220 [marine sediment metagenome]|uniref:Glycosyltransferase 2-like domain-containing protein n=1 Tax=marine sediment metagenome TaxID=412755 RepID=A0A0F9GF94_9ZZZZ
MSKINRNEQNIEQLDVTIIIPAYNEERIIDTCLESVSKLNYPVNKYEVLIVNDGSTDKTAKIVETFTNKYQNMKLLTKKNGGKGSAQNFGLEHAKGKYILITDADAVVEKDWISKMAEDLDEFDMILGSCYAKDPVSWLEKMQNALYLIKCKYGGLRGIPTTGVNNGFRKNIINQIGNFDEMKTSVTGDFIRKAKEKGLNIHYNPNIIVYTKCSNSVLGFLKQKLRWRESGPSSILSFSYTYGLSFFLFGSILLSIFSLNIFYFIYASFIVYLLSFSIYFKPFLRMLKNKQDRYYAKFFVLYEAFELLVIRIILLPYIIFRFIRPRKKPTFSAQRE